MTSNIDAYRKYTAPTTPGRYFKLEDGQSAKVRITSEAYVYTDEFKGKISTRYAWVVWNFAAELAQVLQAGVTVFKTIQGYALDEEWGDPTEYNLTIKREGVGKDTTYAVTASPTRTPLTVDQLAVVAAFDLFDVVENAIPLAQVADAPAEEPSTAAAESDEDVRPDGRKGGDVVIKDLDETKKINLDDIPF